jgi:malate synthase
MGEGFARYRWDEARRLFESVALADDFDEFLTLPAYQKIN